MAAARADETDQLRLAPRPQVEHREAQRTLTPAAELLQNSTFRTVASGLAIVLGLFALLTALFRSYQNRSQSSTLLQTLGAIQVTPKVQLHVVRFGNRLLVLHLASDSVQRVAEINDPRGVETLLGLHDRQLQTDVSPQVEQLLQTAGGMPLRSVAGAGR